MGQIRAMKIGLEQRIGVKVTTRWKIIEWIVELSAVLINRCLVGKDGKTAYARLMGKNSSKEILEIGERVLAKVMRGRASGRRQALKARWEDAVWVGIAKRSNEHIVVLEGGGPAIRCRTVKRRPLGNRWQAAKIEEIAATPRKPNPDDATRQNVEHTRPTRSTEVDHAEELDRPVTAEPKEPLRRNFKITRRILEKYGYSSDCAGCDAVLAGRKAREHTAHCREMLEAAMRDDPDDCHGISERDARFQRQDEQAGAPLGREGPVETETRQQQGPPRDDDADMQPPAEEAQQAEDDEAGDVDDGSQEVLYGSAGEHAPTSAPTPASSRRREDDEDDDDNGQPSKKRRIENVSEAARDFIGRLGFGRYDGSKQKVQKMLMTLEGGVENTREAPMDVSKVMEALSAMEDRSTPHEDDQWREFYKDVTFFDDVNDGKELDKQKVIEARRLEMKYFKEMGVYTKVSKAEVQQTGGKIVSTK